MVAALHVTQDLRLLNHWKEVFIHQEVIETLPYIAFSVAVLNPPPGVLSDLLVQLPKSISPAQTKEVSKALSFHISEAWVLVSHGRHVNVDLLMAHIHIPTDDHPFSFGFQLLAVFVEGFLVQLCFILQSLQRLITRTRHIDCHQVEMFELEGKHSSLLTESWLLQVLKDRYRKILREDSHSRVSSRALTKIPITAISVNLDGTFFELLLIDFSLVYAEDVRHVLLDELRKSLLIEDTADAIHIPHGDPDPVTSPTSAQNASVWFFLLEGAFNIGQCPLVELA